MTQADAEANRALAAWLFDKAMQGKPGTTLDIGCKEPVLAMALSIHGCDATAIDAAAPEPRAPIGRTQLLRVDFESEWPEEHLPGNYALITMVHVFEHMADPLATLRKLRALVNDDGRVFLRLPDHRIPGYERDLTAHHYAIHPYYHCLTSILEALAQTRDTFVVEWTTNSGPGQRDIILRPITKAPRIALAMIVKNEARDLPRCLRSFEPVIDCAFIADTGSTDSTPEIAASTIVKPGVVTKYLGASEQDAAGDWKLQDFSKARNFALEGAEMQGGPDWILWADADDELMTPNALRRVAYWTWPDVFGIWMDGGGGARWIQQRMWKATAKVRFHDRVHEYAKIDGLRVTRIDEGLIQHHSEPGENQEGSNARNMRLLMLQWEKDGQTSRTAFYIANTHRDGGRHKEGAEWYDVRMGFGTREYRDEYLFSRLYLCRCLRALERFDEADAAAAEGLRMAPDWAEFHMERAHIAYTRKDYVAAMAHAGRAQDIERIPETELWREHSAYRDQPLRLMSWCHEHRDDLTLALHFADLAAPLIGRADEEWDARRERLRSLVHGDGETVSAPGILSGARRVVALHRPGAIGDILMTLNLLPAFLDANPDTDVHYFCHGGLAGPDALGRIIMGAGAKLALDMAALPAWRKRYDRVIDLIGYPLAEGYPEKPMRRHLLEYFAEEMGVPMYWYSASISVTAEAQRAVIEEMDRTGATRATVPHVAANLGRSFGPDLPALTLPLPALPSWVPEGDYATMQPHARWSKYKQWQPGRWESVRASLPDIPFVTIDEAEGHTLYESIAAVANARMHVGVDSFAGHLTNYYWTDRRGGRRVPAVMLWGSTQYSAAGYPHNMNISKGLGCQPCFREADSISSMPRGPCINPPRLSYDDETPWQCTAEINVAEVVDAVRAVWAETEARTEGS